MTLRVMTYNIQGHAVLKRARHLQEASAVIRDAKPDVVGLQEVHRMTTRGGGIDQLERLAQETGMALAFGTSMTAWGGEYGNAVLTSGEIVSTTVHALPGRGEKRSMLEVGIKVRGIEFDFFVAHLAAWFWFRRRTRREQLQHVVRLLSQRERAHILVGDFNAAPSSAEVQLLMRHERLQACSENCGVTHRSTKAQLDYIFSDRNWTTLRAEALRVGPSDHWPLVADLERRKGETS